MNLPQQVYNKINTYNYTLTSKGTRHEPTKFHPFSRIKTAQTQYVEIRIQQPSSALRSVDYSWYANKKKKPILYARYNQSQLSIVTKIQ